MQRSWGLSPSILVGIIVILSSWQPVTVQGYMIGNNPYYRAEWLDWQGLYYLEWQVDWSRKEIIFNVTAGTTGYALFGLANNASAATTGADIVTGGVFSNGQPYFADRYAVNSNTPQEDSRNDYTLLAAWENKTHTVLSFSRAIDTCDPFDYPITENKITILWGYGLSDDFESGRKYGVQGAVNIYLLDPDYSPRIPRDRRFNGAPSIVTPDNAQPWSIRREITIPENSTSYVCSIHKAPTLNRKHHMIGWDLYFHSSGSRRRAPRVMIFKCNAPGKTNPRKIFEPLVDVQQSCYVSRLPTEGPIPTHLCTELFAGWAVGGRAMFTPSHVGIPFGQRADEYYMLQVHYENAERRTNVIVDMRLDFFYTSRLRQYEGGMLIVGQQDPALPPSILIPPSTTDHRIFHHCPGECTRRMFPREGIKIFAATIHARLSARGGRLRHFTYDGEELPWILYDDNYRSDFQEARHLRKEVQLYPGDQLTLECTFDSTWTNGTVVGGYRNNQEVCTAFLFYYNRVSDYSYCKSEHVSTEYRRKFLGVSNVTWNEDLLEWVAVRPSDLAGFTMTEISDNYVTWDAEKREELKNFHETYAQVSTCSRDLAYRDTVQVADLEDSDLLKLTGSPPTRVNTEDDYSGPGEYPYRARPYIPEETCSFQRR